MKRILSYFIFGLLFNSCILYNAAPKDEREVCALHGKPFKRTLVGVEYGYKISGGINPEYPNAKRRRYMGIKAQSYRYSIIWSCRKCTKLKRKHKSNQFNN